MTQWRRVAVGLVVLGFLAQVTSFVQAVTLDLSAVDRVGPRRESGINPLPERKVGDEHGQDLASVHLPNRVALGETLRAGKLPSRAFIGEWETAALYPVNWVYAVLPVRAAMVFEVAFHLALVGVGMFLLCRAEGRTRLAALLGATCLVCSGPVWGRLYSGHLSNLATMAWVPLLLALALRGRAALFGAALVLFLFAGHPQYVFYTAMVFGLLALCGWFKELPRLAVAALVAAVLALPQLVPAVEAYVSSRRLGLPYGFSASFYFPVECLWTAVDPFAFGRFESYAIPSKMNAWETSAFFGGFAAVVLAGLGARGRYLLPGALTLLLALGAQTVLYDFLYLHLPVFGSFRGVSKFILFVVMFASLAVARGFDKINKIPLARAGESC